MIFNPQNDSLKHQQVRCVLFNESDTLLIESYRKRDWMIISYFKNWNYMWGGFEGYIDCQEIPKGTYQVGLFVENAGLSLFVDKKKVVQVAANCEGFKF